MSQKQFIRNTMATIHAQATIALAQPSSPDYEDDRSTIASIETTTTGTSATTRPRRSASIRSWMSNPNASFSSLVHFGASTSTGYSRQWDAEMESLLKEMYSAIKSSQIQQPRISTNTDESAQEGTKSAVSLQRSMSHLGHPNARINVLKKGLSAASLKSRINGRNSSPNSGSGSDVDVSELRAELPSFL
jgi:PH and SEC7 domain-containing protein